MVKGRRRRSSYDVLNGAVQTVGVKRAARELRVSAALVYKWCQPPHSDSPLLPDGSGSANPLDRIQKLIELTQSEELLHWICQMGNGFYARNPTPKTLGRLTIFENIQKLVKEFSDTLDAISASYKKGRSIDDEEAQRIRREWDQLKSVGESLVMTCETGHYRRLTKRKSGGRS